jgi:hypothetical protein
MRFFPTSAHAKNISPFSPLALKFVGAMFVLAVLAGCGSVEPLDEAVHSELDSTSQEVVEDNGLNLNGLSLNGLNLNGLSLNGLNLNGLSTETFSQWFGQNASFNETVMRYVVRCAVPEGESRTYTDALGKTYTWQGSLGLAPGWSYGASASVAEQQVVSACLAAHTNKYGIRVPVSLLGRTAQGAEIPSSSGELATFFNREACFFGNLFSGSGAVYVGADWQQMDKRKSSTRACGLSSRSSGGSEDCAPLVHVGSCSSLCTLDASGTYYTSCTYNGVTYRPVTSRVNAESVYTCGDGTCQFTERCGTGDTYDNCKLDCGTCG